MNALFAVAAAGGTTSHEEMEEIRKISTVLKMTHRQFINCQADPAARTPGVLNAASGVYHCTLVVTEGTKSGYNSIK